jgi:hypothetical protein
MESDDSSSPTRPDSSAANGRVLGPPHLPDCAPVSVDGMSFAEIRDRMTELEAHAATQQSIDSLYDDWARNPEAMSPLQRVRDILDAARSLPRGESRLQAMNTIVRSFGQAGALATLIDMLQESAKRLGSSEEVLSRYSRLGSKHSLYGWAGQTKLVSSSSAPTRATLSAEPGVQDMLGSSPVTMWGLNMHIWQPNPVAKGFVSELKLAPGIIVEPPHSHPFDFASMMSIGEIRQSIYSQQEVVKTLQPKAIGRYDGITLSHVQSVWPPHVNESPAAIVTLEDRALVSVGQSYYMPCNVIHDVEVDTVRARTRPAITLFLRSEAVVKPHVYMVPSMLKYHSENPNLKNSGQPLQEKDWDAKLSLVSAYLRGKCDLVLDDIVSETNSYAFFHE